MEESLCKILTVKRASYSEKAIIRHLLQLYSYDFTEFVDTDVDEYGLFGYMYLDHYWIEKERHPFLIWVAGKLAGFAFVREITTEAQLSYFSMAEFFVMRKYRGRGIGQHTAYYLFDLFPGEWRVMQLAENRPAQRFWRKIIDHYTRGQFVETRVEEREGIMQIFDTQPKNS